MFDLWPEHSMYRVLNYVNVINIVSPCRSNHLHVVSLKAAARVLQANLFRLKLSSKSFEICVYFCRYEISNSRFQGKQVDTDGLATKERHDWKTLKMRQGYFQLQKETPKMLYMVRMLVSWTKQCSDENGKVDVC